MRRPCCISAAFWVLLGCLTAAAAASSASDVETARQLPGTWEQVLAHQSKGSIARKIFITFHPDQTFTGLVTVGFDNVHACIEVKGTWRVENGTLVEKITASSVPGAVSATSGRIVSISSSEFITRNVQEEEERYRNGRIPKFLPPLLSPDIAFFVKHPLPKSVVRQAIVAAPKPIYPVEARRDRKVGAGLFGIIVDKPTGNVTAVRVLVSTGHRILDDAARNAVMKWQFKPGIVNKTLVPITFSLTSVHAVVEPQ